MPLFFYHEACAAHELGAGHPESPQRLDAVRKAVTTAIPTLDQRTPGMASFEALARAHSERYVEQLFDLAPARGHVAIDADTSMNPYSLDAARYAGGALLEATALVMNGEDTRAFCCVRPPGHHAERERAMGFCLFNNVAVAALEALEDHGLARVAILDFDVHHGNGTEDIFRDDPRVMLCSSFQYPLYPYTNSPSVEDRLVNVPLPEGTGSTAFRSSIDAAWWPALRHFEPEMILVSAGFDAHADDPLAGLELHDDDYRWLGERIREAADEHCGGRVVAGLEGGYDLAALGRSAASFCYALLG